MTYYIFLKSLRSLEEFRKNHHVKIPPKSPCANFQNPGKFKNPIFNSKISFLHFRPGRPCGPLGLWPSRLPLASLSPQAETSLVGPSSPLVGGVSAGVRFPFGFAPSELIASPSSLCQAGPGCQLCPPPPAAQARPRRYRLSATPRCRAPRLGCHRAVTTPPSFPPLIPLLTPPPHLQWR
jgi:hypothetical protein